MAVIITEMAHLGTLPSSPSPKMLSLLLTAATARAAAVAAHELAHWLAARCIGYKSKINLGYAGLGISCTHVPGIKDARKWQCGAVRHAGWLFSVALAFAVTLRNPHTVSTGYAESTQTHLPPVRAAYGCRLLVPDLCRSRNQAVRAAAHL